MLNIRVAIALAAALALGALSASAQQVTPPTSNESIAAQATSTGEVNSEHPVLQQRNPRYKIQPQDALTISFPISPEFDQKVVVQPDGFINLQGVGGLHVEGMSVPELVEAIKSSYSQILHDPLVDVDLTDFQKPRNFLR
jgi:protein involved in polysaccharide export with SLBB domain